MTKEDISLCLQCTKMEVGSEELFDQVQDKLISLGFLWRRQPKKEYPVRYIFIGTRGLLDWGDDHGEYMLSGFPEISLGYVLKLFSLGEELIEPGKVVVQESTVPGFFHIGLIERVSKEDTLCYILKEPAVRVSGGKGQVSRNTIRFGRQLTRLATPQEETLYFSTYNEVEKRFKPFDPVLRKATDGTKTFWQPCLYKECCLIDGTLKPGEVVIPYKKDLVYKPIEEVSKED